MDNASKPDNLVSMTTEWDVQLAARVGQAVKQLRGAEDPKLSAAKLAERTTEVGYPITKAQISDLELGRKKTVTVPELIALALALGRPPVELIYPAMPHGEVEVWPGVEVESIAAAQWFSGLIPAREIVRIPITEGSTNILTESSLRYEELTRLRGDAARAGVESLRPPEGMTSEEAEAALQDARRHLFGELQKIREQLESVEVIISKFGGTVKDA